MLIGYSAEIQKAMLFHHKSLREKESRQYAAIEAMKLGYGGISYISRLLLVDRKTILKGKRELESLVTTEQTQQR